MTGLRAIGSTVALALCLSCVGQATPFTAESDESPVRRTKWVQFEVRRPLPSRSLGTCVFAGSLDYRGRLPLTAGVGSNQVLGHFVMAHFDRLTIAEGSSPPLEGNMVYPIEAEVRIVQQGLPYFYLQTKVEWMSGSLWSDAGSAVQVVERKGHRVVIEPMRELWPPDRATFPAELRQEVPCSDLKLASVRLGYSSEKGVLNQALVVRAAPEGESLFEIGAPGDRVRVMERRDSWVKVTGMNPDYRYVGWVTEKALGGNPIDAKTRLDEVADPTHVIRQEVLLSTKHTLEDEGMRLPANVGVVVHERRGGVARISSEAWNLVGSDALFIEDSGLERVRRETKKR